MTFIQRTMRLGLNDFEETVSYLYAKLAPTVAPFTAKQIIVLAKLSQASKISLQVEISQIGIKVVFGFWIHSADWSRGFVMWELRV